jgi:hypothetical protein
VIVVDTGPIVALINDRDDHHARCRDFLSRNPGPGPGLPAVATLDHRHFSVVRPRHVSAFTLLP